MKKYRFLSLMLCIILLLQSAAVPIWAAETEEETLESTAAEETEPTKTVVSSGSVSVTNGCRTINGQMPLGGTERLLDTAQAAFVYETTSDTVIYSYNADQRLYPGSLAKILTALIAIEKCDLDAEVTVSTREISQLPLGSITAGLKNGEVVTVRDLLYWLILTSANDAALVLAAYMGGDEDGFVEIMNQRALEIGCTATYFTNCHGLDDSQQYTTARDIARITYAASENPTFAEIFYATSYTVPATNKNEEERTIYSGNHLVYDGVLPQFKDSRVTGGMPSYVSASSGASIALTAQANNMNLVVVIMGCTRTYKENGWSVEYYGNFNEAWDILDYSFDGYKVNRLLYKGQALKQFTVANGENDVVAGCAINLDTVLPSVVQTENLNYQYSIPSALSAPITKGQQLGTVQIWYNNSCVAETEIYALSDIRSASNSGLEIYGASRDDSDISGILTFLGILLLIIVVPYVCLMVYHSVRRSRLRARRRRRRASRRRSR